MIKETILPFDMEEMLKAIRDTARLKELYKKCFKSPMNSQSYLLDMKMTDNISKSDVFTFSELGKLRQRLRNLVLLLPKNTLDRKHISGFHILDTHWFRKGATHDNLNNGTLFPLGPITDMLEEAASEYSLPWGMADVIDNDPYHNLITMYMTIETYPIFVVDIYLAYTFFHEAGHIFSNAAYYSLYYATKFLGLTDIADKRNAYTLTLQNGDQISGNEYVTSFAPLAEQYGPFGSYTAGYKKEDDEELWLRESFADATAAYFLGFMMYPEKDFAPLDPEVWQYMHEFYHALATITKP